MNLIFAVAEDLYLFACDALVSVFLRKEKRVAEVPALPARERHEEISGPIEIFVEEEIYEEDADEEPLTFRSTAEIFDVPPRPQKNTVMYTGSDSTSLFRNPAMEFDGVISIIPYGAMVMVLESRGRWARVAYRDSAGWVLRDELLDRSAYVYPDFTIGVQNNADDPSTLRTRACIEDEFGAGVAGLPLQSSEYVLYRLTKKGVNIAWPEVRPRVEGSWHTILRGISNVHIGVQPCVGCVFEQIHSDGVGHLAYVEAVFPDETISISEVNYPDLGIYNERILTKEEWRELRPVFIQIQ